MGSNFSREGSKDNGSRGGGGGGGGRGKEEEKRVLCFAAYDEPRRRLNQDFVFAAAYGTKDDNKNRNRLRIRSSVEEKEKKKRGGIMIFISAITFILVREFTRKVIQWKREEKEKGKDTTSSSSSITTSSSSSSIATSSSITTSSFSSLSDELQLLIMSKVPVHSLVKFRRVSKTWRSWIYKEHLFLGKCPQHTVGFFFFYGQNGFTYTPLPTNDDNYNYNYSEEDDSDTIFYPPSTSLLPFPTINNGGGDILTFKFCYHASNGLLLLSTFQGQTLQLLVHNPLTRQSLLLPMASQEFSGNPLWIGYEPRRSPYFYVVHAVSMPDSDSPVLQIFSSRSWTWCDLVTTDLRPTYSPRCGIGRAVTNEGRMFIDLTFHYSVILIVDLRTVIVDYVIVPLPPGLPPLLKYACSALGMSAGNMMYAYTHGGVLLVYKLLCLEQGDYRWTLLIEDKSLPDRIASKTDLAPTCHVHARDFLLHVPVLLISADCSKTRRRKIFSYNFNNGSILELFETLEMYSIIPLSLCPLEI